MMAGGACWMQAATCLSLAGVAAGDHAAPQQIGIRPNVSCLGFDLGKRRVQLRIGEAHWAPAVGHACHDHGLPSLLHLRPRQAAP